MDFVRNHLVTADFAEFPAELQSHKAELTGRSCIVRKAQPLVIECVVRGYLAGSGWKEYQLDGTVCGIRLPAGLRQADRLPEPIFTPATKAATGHDENISWQRCCDIVGSETAERVRDLSLRIYSEGRDYAAGCGIILADTKFEFGTLPSGEIILIDECLTPDSSRFWPAARYAAGQSPPSFDKQFVRDYLETLDWSKTPPAPELPAEVVRRTSEKYLEAYERLTGSKLGVS
jgi:phosphoribosylaminoimidazole-succinocarboxamide synthase